MWEQFLTFSRDAGWQFAGFIVGFLALVGMFLIYRWQRNKKELVWEITTNTRLLSSDNHPISNLRVYFKDELVANPSILILKIINNSNSAIVASDFETDFKFICQGAKILEATIDDQTKGLNPVHSFSDNEISIKPLLLNSKDFFAIKILSSEPINNENFSVSARIKDIKEIKQKSFISNMDKFMLSMTVLFAVVAIPAIFFDANTGALQFLAMLVTTSSLLVSVILPILNKRNR